jgi:hypothetical protein
MKRREFFASRVAAGALRPKLTLAAPEPDLWEKLPRWRGFNLFEKFYRNQRFRERDRNR